MHTPLRITFAGALCAGAAILLPSCGGPTTSTTLVPAPPGPADMGPATSLSIPPAEAVVFDLKYRPQTGSADDISYRSYWGYGGREAETRTNSFLQDVRKAASDLHYVYNYALDGRKWSAVECSGRQAQALYFDLNADGKLSQNERIAPTRKADQGIEFITPDFVQRAKDGGQTLCRVLLKVNFYQGNSEPNCMWSPAALLEGSATLDDRRTRLLLFASQPGGEFDQYGRSSFSLLSGDHSKPDAGRYIPRDTLSSLITTDGRFYHLTIEGRYSNGLPARVLLEKDTTPTGALAVKLLGTHALQTAFSSVYLRGAEDPTVVMRVDAAKDQITLPAGAYILSRGTISYGESNRRDWQVSFTDGPHATVKAGAVFEQALGRPTLQVRAVKESDRYDRRATGSAAFKKGTRIYLEPRITGLDGEVFSSFRQAKEGTRGEKPACLPRITITGPDDKELLSKNLEYG